MTFDKIIPFVLLGIGFYLLYWGVKGVLKAIQVKDWPELIGKVILSEVDTRKSRAGSTLMTIYEPIVKYEFEVNEKKYTGDTISQASINTQSSKDAEDKTKQYPLGADVTVYYNPQNPSDNILNKEVSFLLIIILVVIGVIFFSIGVFGITRLIMCCV